VYSLLTGLPEQKLLVASLVLEGELIIVPPLQPVGQKHHRYEAGPDPGGIGDEAELK